MNSTSVINNPLSNEDFIKYKNTVNANYENNPDYNYKEINNYENEEDLLINKTIKEFITEFFNTIFFQFNINEIGLKNRPFYFGLFFLLLGMILSHIKSIKNIN